MLNQMAKKIEEDQEDSKEYSQQTSPKKTVIESESNSYKVVEDESSKTDNNIEDDEFIVIDEFSESFVEVMYETETSSFLA